MNIRSLAIISTAALLTLSACSDPEETTQQESDDAEQSSAQTIGVGSADFPESQIIAETYAQALEAEDFQVERNFQIGAREVYMPALENAEIDLLPEYTGNLLSYLNPETEATSAEDIESALPQALPEGLEVLDTAPAQNKDSLNVTADFAAENDVESIADLADLDSVSVAANPEFAERAYGVPGMEEIYGITGIDFTPISDGGGPATLQALLDGTVDVADIYTTTPSIEENDLVTLEDPEDMIAAQHVVPVVRAEAMGESARAILNEVSAALSTEALTQMNGRNSGDDVEEPATIASDWLEENDLN